MPVFGAGHAAFPFGRALDAMAIALRESSAPVDRVTVVVQDPERAEEARQILGAMLDEGP
jgi:hypothetical protein